MPREPFTSAGSPKKGRKWTPHLHKAFLEAAEAMGPTAAPAAILEHMGPAAAGLTRDAVAAHLQKHRSGVLRSGSRKSLDSGGGVGCGGDGRKGLASLRTRSTPNLVTSRPCRRSPRTPRRGAALPPGLQEDLRRRSGTFGGGTEDATSGSNAVNAGGDGADDGDGNHGSGGGGGCGLDPAWRLPPAQPPAHWCLGGGAGLVTGAGPATGDGMPSAAVFPAPLPGWGLPPVVPAGCGIMGLMGQQGPPPLQQQQAALQHTLQQAGACTTVTTGAAGLALQGAAVAQQLGLQGLAAIAVGGNGGSSRSGSPCTGSGGSTALAAGLPPTPPSAPSLPQPQQPQQHEPMLQGCVDVHAAPQPQQPQPQQFHEQQQPQQHLTQQAPGSPDGTGAAAGDFGAAFDAAADTSFDLATGLSSEDSDGELWSMAELTAAALAIPPEVLAEADLQPLVSEALVGSGTFAPSAVAAAAAINSAANSAASSPSAVIGIAAAGNAASTWGCAATAAQPQAPQMMVQTLLQPAAAAAAATAAALPNAYAPYGSLPPLPFRMSSGSFGGAGAFAACPLPPYFTSGGCGGGSMAVMSGCGAQQQGSSPVAAALQGGPPRFACISAPAICMGTKMALADAVQYEAQHALMLEDLRGRPKEPPIGLKLDKQSVLEELQAAA